MSSIILAYNANSGHNSNAKTRRVHTNRRNLRQLFHIYRAPLKRIAAGALGVRMRQREDPSDIIQVTFFEAHRDIEKYRGKTQKDLLAWLRKILDHNCKNSVRSQCAARRDIRKQVSLDRTLATASLAGPSNEKPGKLESDCDSAKELNERIAGALKKLPVAQRKAISFRYLEEMPLAQIACRLDRSYSATAGLLKRGLRNLRNQLQS